MRRFHTTGGNASRQRKFYESKNHFSRRPGGNNHRKKCNGRPLPKQPLYPHLCRGNYTKRIRQSKHSPGAIHTTTNRHKNSGKHLYPGHYDPAKKYPAIVVAHPNGGVKEQVAGLYAQNWRKTAISPLPSMPLIRAQAVANHAIPTSRKTGLRTFAPLPIT